VALLRLIGAVIIVLVVVWIVLALVGVLSAILRSVFIVLVILALIWFVYHLLSGKWRESSKGH
jgi:hypothetical protein